MQNSGNSSTLHSIVHLKKLAYLNVLTDLCKYKRTHHHAVSEIIPPPW